MLECQHLNRRKITTRYHGPRSRILHFLGQLRSSFGEVAFRDGWKAFTWWSGAASLFQHGKPAKNVLSLFPKGLAGLSLFPIPAVILNLFCPDFCSLETVYVRRLVPPVSGTFADPSDGTDRRSDATLGNGGEANSKQPLRSTCLQKQRCWGGGEPGETVPGCCSSRELMLALGCRSWGSPGWGVRRVVKRSPCGAYCSSRGTAWPLEGPDSWGWMEWLWKSNPE